MSTSSNVLIGFAVALTCSALAWSAQPKESGNPAVTRCDELTAHPLDPDRVTTGVPTAEVELIAGIDACEAAVAAQPDNARLHYQLGRVLFYGNRGQEALHHLEIASSGGHRQAQFVLGYIIDEGLQGAPQDPCRVEDLWARSARSGRLAALVSYPHHVVRGRFAGCDLQVSDEELMSFLERARERELDYYQTVLVNDVTEDLEARMADREARR